jgi:hypothetical protein
MAARLPHGVAETQCTHIDVWLPFGPAFLPQLAAAVPDPGRGLVEFCGRKLPFALGFWAAVGARSAAEKVGCPRKHARIVTPSSAARRRAG